MQASPAAAPQPLSESELRQAHLYLQQTSKGVAGAIKLLSEEQWRYKPAPESWSIAEIVDHVIFVQEYVLGPLRVALSSAPAPAPGRDPAIVDAIVIQQLPVRLAKFSSPDAAIPSGKFSLPDALCALSKNNARLAEFLESDADLRAHAVPSPPLKAITRGAHETMDGYQWILAAGAHTERHTKQILEIIAAESFPR